MGAGVVCGWGRWPRWLLTLAVTAQMFWMTADAQGQNLPVPPSRVLLENEELTYNVRYGFINLGQVRIKILSTWKDSGTPVYRARGLIDSYRGVPFVTLHAVYESVIDSAAFSHHFLGTLHQDDYSTYSQYAFEYDKQRVLMEVGGKDSLKSRRDTLEVHTHCQDGLSLFFLARERLFSSASIDIPTIVSEKKVNTHIDFRNEETSAEIDAIEYPVDVIHFEGTADFVGLFGLTGDFEGWFSNDEARVPILAKLKVLIGSVTVELMGWKRPGWTPPRAKG
jgi:hypothetical protein